MSSALNQQRLDMAHIYKTAQARSELRARNVARDGDIEGHELVITDAEADALVVNQHVLSGAALLANQHGGFKFVRTGEDGQPLKDSSGQPVFEELSGIDALTRHGLKDQVRLAFYNLPETTATVGQYRSALTELIHLALVEYVLWQWYKDLGADFRRYEQAWLDTVKQIKSHAGQKKIFKRRPSVF